MVFATAFHLMRGEYAGLPFNIALILMALFVVWGRSTKAVIHSKEKQVA